MTIVDSPGGKQEVVDFIEQCGAELAKAGVKVLINTDDPITGSRFLLRTAATAVRGGLSEELTLKAITYHAAQVMHLDHRIGSLEKGKDADFVVLSGTPFSVYTRVLQTYIDGKKVFELADDKQRLYQTGGFAVADRSRLPAAMPMVTAPSKPKKPAVPENAPKPTSKSKEVLILAGRIHTVANGSIDDGAILLRDGKIVAIGKRDEVAVPKGIPIVSALEVTPGLIDAHSVVPLDGEYNIPADQDANERSDPNQADVRTLDGFNPAEPLLRYVLEQGVTVIHACPGRDNVIGGATGVFRTHGRSAESMTIRFPQAMMFNLGSQPKQTYRNRLPGTRMGTAALIRKAFTEAANDARKRKNVKPDADPPARNLKHEALALVLDQKLKALFCAQRADDLLTALRLTREFKLDTTIALAADGYLITNEITKAAVPVIVHPTMQRVGGLETYGTILGNAAHLSDKGILTAISSGVEGYVPKTRVARFEAAIAMVYGLGFQRALKSITLDAAKILGIDDRFGSLEVGKTADLVLYDGDPFEHTTHVTHVLVDGRVVYNRSQRSPMSMAQRFLIYSPELPCCLGW